MSIYYFNRLTTLLIFTVCLLTACSQQEKVMDAEGTAGSADKIRTDRKSPGQPTVAQVMDTMSLKEKVGQMFMITFPSEFHNKRNNDFERTLRRIRKYKAGGVMLFGGHPYEAARNIQRFQRRSDHSLLVAADFEWGLPMRLSGGTRFPENMAVAATRNTDFAYKQGFITAQEAKSLGVHMNFAPVMDVNNNPDNPIINVRSYGGNPELVSRFGQSYIRGLQSQNVAATVKHFPGHGDTDTDSHLSLPMLDFEKKRLDTLELAPFKAAIEAGAKAMMVAHIAMSKLPFGDRPATLSPYLLQDILRDSLNYEGVVISDAMNMGGIKKGYWPGESAVKAIQSGVDIILYEPDFELAYETVLEAVREGRITKESINESVRRILELRRFVNVKQVQPDFEEMEDVIEDPSHTASAKKMFQESITLVRDETGNIPLDPGKVNSVVTLIVTDDMRYGYPGGAFESKLSSKFEHNRVIKIGPNSSNRLMSIAKNAVKRADAVVLGVFVRFGSFKGRLNLPDQQAGFISEILKLNKPVIATGFGTPYMLRYFPKANTYLTTYSSGYGAQRAAVEAITGGAPISGKLPIRLPSGYSIGHGLERDRLNSTWDMVDRPEQFKEVTGIVQKAIRDSVSPGMTVYVAKDGKVVLNRGYGRYTYDEEARQITRNTVFDLASLTKVAATIPLAMEFNEQRLLLLDKEVNSYLPEFTGGWKDQVTVRQVLNHTAGLTPHVRFWERTADPDSVMRLIYDKPLAYKPQSEFQYSDLGYMLLGKILEKVGRSSLDTLAQRYIYHPLGMNHTYFTPPDTVVRYVPPTEFDEIFQRELIKGVVHDGNSYFLGGVAGHAGLFSTAQDLGRYAQMLLRNGYYNGRKFFSTSTIHTFTRPQNIVQSSTRALGWDTPGTERSLYGDYATSKAYGHLGFTGTSILIDPGYDLIVILLTNRVYPSREKSDINPFRREFHNAVYKAILDE